MKYVGEDKEYLQKLKDEYWKNHAKTIEEKKVFKIRNELKFYDFIFNNRRVSSGTIVCMGNGN